MTKQEHFIRYEPIFEVAFVSLNTAIHHSRDDKQQQFLTRAANGVVRSILMLVDTLHMPCIPYMVTSEYDYRLCRHIFTTTKAAPARF